MAINEGVTSWTKTKPILDHECELIVSKNVYLSKGKSKITKVYEILPSESLEGKIEYRPYEGSKVLEYEDINGDWYLIVEL